MYIVSDGMFMLPETYVDSIVGHAVAVLESCNSREGIAASTLCIQINFKLYYSTVCILSKLIYYRSLILHGANTGWSRTGPQI